MANFYDEIAKEMMLEAAVAKKFCTFMRKRFPGEEQTHCLTGYAKEWAGRFKRNDVRAAADSRSQEVLNEIETPNVVQMPIKTEIKTEPKKEVVAPKVEPKVEPKKEEKKVSNIFKSKAKKGK